MRDDAVVSFVLVSFHAHPDDESLLTGGTLARAASEGHRVVVVVATAGGEGLVAGRAITATSLADQRIAELHRSAEALGVARVHLLGYDDSGLDGTAAENGNAFAHADVDQAAERLAALLREEQADALTIYDPHGGYGHPDHVQVHRVGVRAAQLAGTRVVLEATVDRTLLRRTLGLLRILRVSPADWSPDRFATAYSDRADLTHRVDVRRYARQKRAAMAAHASQATADTGTRTLAIFLRLPLFVFRRVFGHEWFIERGRRADGIVADDIFSTLRESGREPGDGHKTRSATNTSTLRHIALRFMRHRMLESASAHSRANLLHQ